MGFTFHFGVVKREKYHSADGLPIQCKDGELQQENN
jgi:hypothetical protein